MSVDAMIRNIKPLRTDYSSERERTLAQVFHRYFGAGIPFLPPRELDRVRSEIPAVAARLMRSLDPSRTSAGQEEQTWTMEAIIALLEKGYNPVPLWSAFLSASLCVAGLEGLSGRGDLQVLELGCGAGWSTLILYNLLRQFAGERFVLHSVDSSPYAIASTSRMLSHFHIPYRIVVNGEEVVSEGAQAGADWPTVTLRMQPFTSALDRYNADSIGAAYSNHATAYLEPSAYRTVIEKLYRVLIPGGTFTGESLDPDFSLRPGKLFVLGAVLRGRNRERFSRFPPEQRYEFKAGEGGYKIIRVMRDEPSAAFLDWLHYLLYHGHLGILGKYFGVLQRSVGAQRKMRSWVRVPSRDLRSMIEEAGPQRWQVVSSPIDALLPPYIHTLQIRKSINPGGNDETHV